MHLFVILQFYTILCILICCEAARTFLDLVLYQIKYIISIIIMNGPTNCLPPYIKKTYLLLFYGSLLWFFFFLRWTRKTLILLVIVLF